MIYVGHLHQAGEEIVETDEAPTQEAFPQYCAMTGPFKSRDAAEFFVRNPWCQNVFVAERLCSKKTESVGSP